MLTIPRPLSLAFTTLLAACGSSSGPTDATTNLDATSDAATAPDALPDVVIPALRAPGVRAPRTAMCGDVDPTRCLLPWPANTFTTLDATTATGIRLAVAQSSLGRGDDPAALLQSDGFSRATPVLTLVDGTTDATTLGDGATAAIRIVDTQPGDAFGTLVPVRMDLQTGYSGMSTATLLRAYPRIRFAAASEHLAVVMDSMRHTDGTPYVANTRTRIALGLTPPVDADTAALFAYHAPSRTALARAGIDPNHVVQLWDFTTGSEAQPRLALAHMRDLAFDAINEGGVHVVFDTVRIPAAGSSAAVICEGRLTGIPYFLHTDRTLAIGTDGLPELQGTHDGLFRVLIPAGTGDYPVVMYGHGTGGDIHDDAFDDTIGGHGIAKVSMQFDGWAGDDVLNTIGGFAQMVHGTDVSTARLAQSLTDGMTTLRALHRVLGNALAAATLGTTPNPAVGRHPDLARPMWAGGSLGGSLGFTFTEADPEITASVINVPGAAWTHFMVYSNLYTVGSAVLAGVYHTPIDRILALSTVQSVWDRVDGAAWAGARPTDPPVILLQESIGDPVLPNIGNEFAATCAGATQVGVILSPIPSQPHADMVVRANGITQFHTPDTDVYGIHGFAARDTLAGVAAREQIVTFLTGNLTGNATIVIPPTCLANTPAGSVISR